VTEAPSVFVFGASGHAKVVIDAIERSQLARVAFVCDDAVDRANLDAHLRKASSFVLWCSLNDHRLFGMEATLRTRKHRG